jgi:hypothetical protein
MGTIFSRIILESKPPAALLLEDFVLEHGNVTEAATEVRRVCGIGEHCTTGFGMCNWDVPLPE